MLITLGTSSWALGIGVAVFTLLSGVASSFLLLVNLLNRQHYNYVSILAILIALYNFNSVVIQIYSLLNFSQILSATFKMVVKYFECKGADPMPLFMTPDRAVSILLSLQLYLMNSQAFLFFYWSLVLFASSWNLSPKWWKSEKALVATKLSCFVIPGVQLGILHVKAVYSNDIANMLVMNAPIIINIGMSSVFLMLTLLNVIAVHREARGTKIIRLSVTYDGVIEFYPRELTAQSAPTSNQIKKRSVMKKFGGESDSWLIGRIALAFVMMEGLQIYMIIMQLFFLRRWEHFEYEWRQGHASPAVSQSEEFANICSPIPGSLTGYLFFLVFGTTLQSRLQIRNIIRRCLCCVPIGDGYRGLKDSHAVYNYKPSLAIPRPPRPMRPHEDLLLLFTPDGTPLGSSDTSGRSSSPTLGRTLVTGLGSEPSSLGSSRHNRAFSIHDRRCSVWDEFSFEFGLHTPTTPYRAYSPLSASTMNSAVCVRTPDFIDGLAGYPVSRVASRHYSPLSPAGGIPGPAFPAPTLAPFSAKRLTPWVYDHDSPTLTTEGSGLSLPPRRRYSAPDLALPKNNNNEVAIAVFKGDRWRVRARENG